MHNPKSRPKQPKAPTAPGKSCGTCRFLQSYPDHDGKPSDGGECRRDPPTYTLKIDGSRADSFPGVRKADIWCGEWGSRPTRANT
jgi:hypothetical protein